MVEVQERIARRLHSDHWHRPVPRSRSHSRNRIGEISDWKLKAGIIVIEVTTIHCCPVKPGAPARNGMILNGVLSI
jgi:hypothetical protein